jgi:hypothetical protein
MDDARGREPGGGSVTWVLYGLAFGAGFVTAAGLAMWQHVAGTYGQVVGQ